MKFIIKTPTSTSSKHYFVDCEPPTLFTRYIEAFLGEKVRIVEELVEGEKPLKPTNNMTENRKPEVFTFPIRDIDGEANMKNNNSFIFLHFHGKTT